jgi:hypothetical protein
MADSSRSPGPIAERTFDRGFKVAVVGGVGGVWLLYWIDVLSVSNTVHATVTIVLFPVYLIFAATLLGVWLGFDTDRRDLERVRTEVDPDSEESG